MVVVEQVLERIEGWSGRAISIEPLSGGLTNINYKVQVDGTPYVVRVPGESTELLAIDRNNEYHNTRAAAQAGVGPEVQYYLPGHCVMVLKFLEGRTMSKETLNAAGMPGRMAQTIRQLHAGPRFLTDFNMFRLTDYYLRLCLERGIRIPDGYVDRMPTVLRMEQAMAVSPLPTVPCNNDLLAENYIDDGRRLWLIDYEYSGNNDPTFELGNTAQEMEFKEEQIRELCEGYFGEVSSSKIARMKLNMIMSDVGWGLWAAIQADISKIEFDFWGWALERWTRAEQKMDSGEFEGWIAAVQL